MSTASTRICAPIKQMGIIPKTMQDIAFYKWNCTLNPYWAHITQNICTHRLHQCRMCLINRHNKTGRRRKIDEIRGLGDFRIGTSVERRSRGRDSSFIQSPHGAAATVERRGTSWSIDRSVPICTYLGRWGTLFRDGRHPMHLCRALACRMASDRNIGMYVP